ncbi:MAG: J domain-containing protein [Spirochaetia bacterium]|nr:J domain-containing protein [Spirochaetia bacterium]
MDQLFDRLERLVKSWINAGSDASFSPSGFSSSRRTSSGDPDLDAAMAELDDFLDTSKTETERREAEAKRREEAMRAEAERREWSARQEQNRFYRSGPNSGSGVSQEDTSKAIREAYAYLGLPAYAPFPEVKSAYKKLLFKYHPDRNSSSPEALKKATETSTRINAAYQIIEAYEEARNGKQGAFR